MNTLSQRVKDTLENLQDFDAATQSAFLMAKAQGQEAMDQVDEYEDANAAYLENLGDTLKEQGIELDWWDMQRVVDIYNYWAP